jgi:tetratricopeptide (TPR) repeat protein
VPAPAVDAADARRDPRAKRVAAAALIVVLTFTVYFPTLFSGFIWDDDLYLTENPVITAPGGLKRIWTSADCPQYYPLVFTTFWIEHRLWGLAPAGYHVVNVALHAANSLLIMGLLTRLGLRGAWLAAAIFAVHPVHVESVAWITERKNVLSLLFYLLAFRSFLRFEDERARGSYFAALLFFTLALLSKTAVCSLPVALLLVHWARGRAITPHWLRRLAPFFAIGLALAVVTVWYEHHHVGAAGTEFDLSLAQRVIIAGRALWFYAGKLVWPANLSFIYPRWTIDSSNIIQYVAPFGALLVLALLLLARRRLGRWPFAGAALFVLTLVPALGFINVYLMRFSFVADHFQYVASIGLIAVFAGVGVRAVGALPQRTRNSLLPKAAGGVWVLTLALFAWMQTFSYADAETLWRDTLARNPQAWIAHNNLGVLLLQRGDAAGAIECHRRATQIQPLAADAWAALGAALTSAGRVDEGIAAYQRAITLAPGFAEVHFALAEALVRQNRLSEALQHYHFASQLRPDEVRSAARLVEALAAGGYREVALQIGQAELERWRHRSSVSPQQLARVQDMVERLGRSHNVVP